MLFDSLVSSEMGSDYVITCCSDWLAEPIVTAIKVAVVKTGIIVGLQRLFFYQKFIARCGFVLLPGKWLDYAASSDGRPLFLPVVENRYG